MCLKKDEISLIGKWVFKDGKIVEDSVVKRINKLIHNHLVKIASNETGWKTIYKDPNDNRYWVLEYRDSELQGGGAPSLINISKEEANSKYNI